MSDGVNHSATGNGVFAHARAIRGIACDAIKVLPPPVGMRKHTHGTAPNSSVRYGMCGNSCRPIECAHAASSPIVLA